MLESIEQDTYKPDSISYMSPGFTADGPGMFSVKGMQVTILMLLVMLNREYQVNWPGYSRQAKFSNSQGSRSYTCGATYTIAVTACLSEGKKLRTHICAHFLHPNRWLQRNTSGVECDAFSNEYQGSLLIWCTFIVAKRSLSN
jgi:hypothetical protein